MSQTTALHGGDTPAYSGALLSYLGERDPIEVFESTESALRNAVKGLNEKQLRSPEASGKWAVIEVVQHLADVEILLAQRFRAVIAEPGARIEGRDQDAWAKQLRYIDAPLDEALDQFHSIRAINLRVLRETTAEQRQSCYGLHSERGKETLDHIMRLYAAHDLYHLYQIERIRNRIGVNSRPPIPRVPPLGASGVTGDAGVDS